MNLAKTSALSAVSVVTRMATAVLLNKVLAVHVGPAGYGVIGQFQNLVGIAGTLASAGVNTGVTKYTAEYAEDVPRQHAVWSTACRLGLVGALACAAALVIGSGPLARWAFDDDTHRDKLLWLAGSLVLLVLNGLMQAILNGRKAVRSLTLSATLGSVASALFAMGMVSWRGLDGALVAIACSQAIAFGITAWIFVKVQHLSIAPLFGGFDAGLARSLGGYAAMTAASALANPIAQMVIRDRMALDQGWDVVGLWQGLWKISELHLMLLTTTLSVYLLPRLAEIRSGSELTREVLSGYRFVLPLSIASAIFIYLLKDRLVQGLLSPAFGAMVPAMGVQLVGDVLKINSWVLAYTMVSHAQTRLFIATELGFALLLAGSTLWGARTGGLYGTALAYAGTYAVYGAVCLLIFRRLRDRLDAARPAQGCAS